MVELASIWPRQLLAWRQAKGFVRPQIEDEHGSGNGFVTFFALASTFLTVALTYERR